MIDFEEIKKYLPQYLSSESQDKLFEDLKGFPTNLDQFYSFSLSKNDSFYQGDGVSKLLVVDLPNPKIGELPSLIISNSCDIEPKNERFFSSRVLYAPIFKLEKYKNALILDNVKNEKYTINAVEDHIKNIKNQLTNQILFLPKGGQLEDDSIVFLDRINSCPIEQLNKTGNSLYKLFTLSNYGFYVFLIKLSIYFTRIREGIDRI